MIKCFPTKRIQTTYISITRAEGIEYGCVSVEQRALLGRQSTTAKVGNEVREKSSVSEVPRRGKNKGQLDKGGEQKVMGMLPTK